MDYVIDLADAVVELLKPEYGEVARAVSPWLRRAGLSSPQFKVFNDPQDEARELIGKDKTKETITLVVSMVSKIAGDWSFERLCALVTKVSLWEPGGAIVIGSGTEQIRWMHAKPNKVRVRYVPEYVKEEGGVIVGTFVSQVEARFWRYY